MYVYIYIYTYIYIYIYIHMNRGEHASRRLGSGSGGAVQSAAGVCEKNTHGVGIAYTLLVCQPLPCSPSSEAAVQPLIGAPKSLSS